MEIIQNVDKFFKTVFPNILLVTGLIGMFFLFSVFIVILKDVKI